MSRSRFIMLALAAIVAIAALVWAFWPQPVPVDLAGIERGPMEVTVSANGVTRIKNTYLVTAPITGTTRRSPVEIGDEVVHGETIVATIEPAAPALLDARARAEGEAAIAEAEASLVHAQANVERAQADVDYSSNQYERSQRLAAQGTIPQRMLDDATLHLRTVETALAAAESDVERQRAALQRARAQFVGPEDEDPRLPEPGACCVEIHAPAGGTILSIENISARLVQAGEKLLTVGQPDDLEITVELLSADAVRIRPGADAHIARWGGEDDLAARVRRIEPSARTEISALGIEEQRVNVLLDLITPPEDRPGLGDNFRVFASIVEWAGEDVLQVPIGALFRQDEDWAVYRVSEDETAEPVALRIGRRTSTTAEVIEGLEQGDRVILYPGDRIEPGTNVIDRSLM